jgi:hypothetical protein
MGCAARTYRTARGTGFPREARAAIAARTARRISRIISCNDVIS